MEYLFWSSLIKAHNLGWLLWNLKLNWRPNRPFRQNGASWVIRAFCAVSHGRKGPHVLSQNIFVFRGKSTFRERFLHRSMEGPLISPWKSSGDYSSKISEDFRKNVKSTPKTFVHANQAAKWQTDEKKVKTTRSFNAIKTAVITTC